MIQQRYLALASLLFAICVAAPALPAAETGAHSDPPTIDLTYSPLTSIDLVSAVPPLPDAPSPALQQDPSNQTPPPPQSRNRWPDQPTGPISAEEQLKIQEQQRVFAVMPAYNTTINRDAMPLSSGQKFQLFFKSQADPWPFLLAGAVAGINQANDSFSDFGQGMKGYAKRYGVAYGDAFIGNLFGNAILTSWWREDPRYFQKGTGSATSRVLWAATSTVWCRRDNGTWGPNYANIAGNMIGAAIANVYYPESERTWGDTLTRGLTVSAEGIIGSEVIEFWPDMVRRHRRKQAEKLARQGARQNSQTASGSSVKASPSGTDPRP
ncbi:MAG: hypothetical protein JOZ83_00195 [Silvibacterium sp.]|nr:hypothetical protein [Silvibacterium sp.]